MTWFTLSAHAAQLTLDCRGDLGEPCPGTAAITFRCPENRRSGSLRALATTISG